MSPNPYLSRISIFPLKSLDGLNLNQVRVLASGALEHDREFALFDAQGKFVNGKRNPKVHRLRSTFAADIAAVTLRVQDASEAMTLALTGDRSDLETWLSQYFGFGVTVAQNCRSGFPDDTVAAGPTLISTATLETVASWFPGISVEQIRDRLRANLEIGGVPPFWEDQLFAGVDEAVDFQIGPVQFYGINPCQRCVVPTRDPQTGVATAKFQKIFTEKRQQTLPAWTNPARWNHFYRLSVNTIVPPSEAGKILYLGDRVQICGVSRLSPPSPA